MSLSICPLLGNFLLNALIAINSRTVGNTDTGSELKTHACSRYFSAIYKGATRAHLCGRESFPLARTCVGERLAEIRAPIQNELMLWEGRPLRDIHEVDVRRLLESGLGEHLQLEYKSALYEDSDRGGREFLLDI